MELTQFLILLFLLFFASYFGMCGVIYLMRRLKKYDHFDFNMPLGLCLILPILLLSPFIDFFKVTPGSFYFTALASFALAMVFLASFPLKTAAKFGVFFLFNLLATLLLPSDLPLFQTGLMLAGVSHVLLALGLTGFMYLFAWMDRIPFLSLTTSLAFAVLIVLCATLLNILPLLVGVFALFIVTAQMGVSICLKPFLPFRLGYYAAYAIAFLWGFMGIYLASLGYKDIPLFASGYYLTELAFVFVMTFATHRVLGFKTPALIEYALQTNIQTPRVFRIVLLYTIALGLLGLWNARVPNVSFVVAAFLFLGYLTYQFLNWSDRPTFKNVLNELKNGYAELKKEVLEMKNQRAEMKAHKAHSTHVAQSEPAKVSAKTVKKTPTKSVRSVKKETKTSASKTKPTTLQKATQPRKRKKTGLKVKK